MTSTRQLEAGTHVTWWEDERQSERYIDGISPSATTGSPPDADVQLPDLLNDGNKIPPRFVSVSIISSLRPPRTVSRYEG